jgi:hypothetical protein
MMGGKLFGINKKKYSLFFAGSGWQQHTYQQPSRKPSPIMPSIGKRPESRHFGKEAAMEHGTRMRHQYKNVEYLSKLGVNNGFKGSGNPFIDPTLSTNNQTVLVGKQIILRCHIEDARNKSVS